jgi:folate-binding protein YgfZ
MLANFRLFKHGDTYYLRMPRELVEDTLERLRKFVLRSKVTLEDADDALVRMGYSGPDAEKELSEAVGDIPQEVDAVTQTQDLVVIRVPGPHPRFEIYGELEPVKKVFSALNVHGAPVGASPWAVLEILAGIPTVFPETVEAFVPQMANMDKINGVSLKKGCYPGQEIVARTHYLGKLKRRMYRVHIDSDDPPKPGTEIFPAQGESEENVGRVVDAQPDPDDGTAALAVLQRASAETAELRLGSRDGPLVRLEALPYSVED